MTVSLTFHRQHQRPLLANNNILQHNTLHMQHTPLCLSHASHITITFCLHNIFTFTLQTCHRCLKTSYRAISCRHKILYRTINGVHYQERNYSPSMSSMYISGDFCLAPEEHHFNTIAVTTRPFPFPFPWPLSLYNTHSDETRTHNASPQPTQQTSALPWTSQRIAPANTLHASTLLAHTDRQQRIKA